MDFKKLMNSGEYDFLRTNPRLGERIILMGPGGSYAYGTNNEKSDIDFRGITLNLPSDLLGMTKFEQYLLRTTLGQELLDQKHLFLSKRAAKSFGGYASKSLSMRSIDICRCGITKICWV